MRTKFITPALIGANGEKWDVMTQIREECYFTKGRVIVRGKTVKRGVAKKADYLLDYRPNLVLAVLEAKDNNHVVGAKKRNVFAKYGDLARAVLEALLQKYSDTGISSVESMDILKVDPLTAFGTPMEIVKLFGDKESYLAAIRELEQALYHEAA